MHETHQWPILIYNCNPAPYVPSNDFQLQDYPLVTPFVYPSLTQATKKYKLCKHHHCHFKSCIVFLGAGLHLFKLWVQ
jgi:hypothetical protein